MPDVHWEYDAGEWERTRVVDVFQAEDGLYYWSRSRIKGGVRGKVVAVSGGFIEELQARISATKENYPLPVQPASDPEVDVPPGDKPVDPDVPPGPVPGEPPEEPDVDEGGPKSKARAKAAAKKPTTRKAAKK